MIIFKSHIRLTLILLLILSAFSCRNNEDEKALAYLTEARAYFYSGHYKDALLKIDTLEILYSKSYHQIRTSALLKDSIRKTVSELKIDSLNNTINKIKIQLYTSNKNLEKSHLLKKIDSIQSMKTIHKATISEIECRESKIAAQCQCKTIMQKRN